MRFSPTTLILIVIAPFIFSQNAKGHSISSISNPLLIDTVKKLVWSDEFDIPGLPNKSKWAYDIGTGDHGWGNNELEYYTFLRGREPGWHDEYSGTFVVKENKLKESLSDFNESKKNSYVISN
jgi:hypothetical protein